MKRQKKEVACHTRRREEIRHFLGATAIKPAEKDCGSRTLRQLNQAGRASRKGRRQLCLGCRASFFGIRLALFGHRSVACLVKPTDQEHLSGAWHYSADRESSGACCLAPLQPRPRIKPSHRDGKWRGRGATDLHPFDRHFRKCEL